jgi:hypothetical protein
MIKTVNTSEMSVSVYETVPSGTHVSRYGKWRSRGTRATQCPVRGYSWATLSPGDVNTAAWFFGLGVGLTTSHCKKKFIENLLEAARAHFGATDDDDDVGLRDYTT